jgi:hypothetical protein
MIASGCPPGPSDWDVNTDLDRWRYGIEFRTRNYRSPVCPSGAPTSASRIRAIRGSVVVSE